MDDKYRHFFIYKNPHFLHLFPSFVLPNPIVGLFYSFGAAQAEIWSSNDYTPAQMASKCIDYQRAGNDTAFDKCDKCFFLVDGIIERGKYRKDYEITFNTANYACELNSTLYYYSMADCNKAYDDNIFVTWQLDACQLCMHGQFNEFATIDGPNKLSGIVFSYDMEDEWTDCDIHNPKWVSCADGWYGLPEFDSGQYLMGCSKCPTPGSTSPKWDGKEIQITDCYISSTTKLTDSSGTYSYSQDCYYTK